jgi:hypothetical protein
MRQGIESLGGTVVKTVRKTHTIHYDHAPGKYSELVVKENARRGAPYRINWISTPEEMRGEGQPPR